MKKIGAIALASAMVLSSMSVFAADFTPAESYDAGERVYTGRAVTTAPNPGDAGNTVDTTVYAGEEGKDYTDEAVYTYNDVSSKITGLNWNPQSWETNDDSYVLDYITVGFYTFVLNEDKTGYSVVPEMAAALPEDVTANYVGSYGVEEGQTAKAWRIALNPDAVWEDGTPINADTYVYSFQQQLNPKMLQRRADSYYSGDLVVVNAKNYLYAGQEVYDALAYATADEAVAAGEEVFVDAWDFYGLEGMTDADGNECPQYLSINDETKYRDLAVEDEESEDAWVSGKDIYEAYFAAGAAYESYGPDYCYTASVAASVSWEDVGLVKVDDYTIDIILESSVPEPAFNVPYQLGSNWIVYEPLFESCKSFYDANGNAVETEEEAATVSTTYCTSIETSIGYGPYKLTSYELDKQLVFERNENWYGYSDGKHLGMYQTDRIVCQAIEEHATQMMSFLAGEIDGVGLQADDMETYASSSYIQYEPQSYTTKLTFNTDYDKLVERGTGSQVLVIDEFRQAIAYALNREEFATAYTSAGTAGFGLLNNMYVYDPFSGALYRDSEAAKIALLDVYNVAFGEGTDYATVDEAFDAMTGYDLAKAQELMAVAYDKAVESGIYDGQSDITIDMRVYTSDTIYVQMFTYLENQLKAACEGTGFEGKVSMTMTVDADYYNTMYSGAADMIFSTWGGSSMSPFGMVAQVYTDAADGSGNQMEYGFDTTAISMTVNVDGNDITASLQDWANWCNNASIDAIDSQIGSFADYDYATQCAVFANVEECFLSYYTTTPLYYRNVASLHSQKVNNAVDSYLQLVGFGGIQYMTYNYDDDAWASYISGNTLQY